MTAKLLEFEYRMQCSKYQNDFETRRNKAKQRDENKTLLIEKKHNTETMIIKILTFNVANTRRIRFSNRKDALNLISTKKAT